MEHHHCWHFKPPDGILVSGIAWQDTKARWQLIVKHKRQSVVLHHRLPQSHTHMSSQKIRKQSGFTCQPNAVLRSIPFLKQRLGLSLDSYRALCERGCSAARPTLFAQALTFKHMHALGNNEYEQAKPIRTSERALQQPL